MAESPNDDRRHQDALTPKPRVFISHDTRDQLIAAAFQTLLQRAGLGALPAFRSTDYGVGGGIEFGANWYDRIESALQQCEEFVCLLTERSFQKPWVLFEAGLANARLPTIKAVLMGIEPDELRNTPFAQYQACPAAGEELTSLVIQMFVPAWMHLTVTERDAYVRRSCQDPDTGLEPNCGLALTDPQLTAEAIPVLIKHHVHRHVNAFRTEVADRDRRLRAAAEGQLYAFSLFFDRVEDMLEKVQGDLYIYNIEVNTFEPSEANEAFWRKLVGQERGPRQARSITIYLSPDRLVRLEGFLADPEWGSKLASMLSRVHVVPTEVQADCARLAFALYVPPNGNVPPRAWTFPKTAYFATLEPGNPGEGTGDHWAYQYFVESENADLIAHYRNLVIAQRFLANRPAFTMHQIHELASGKRVTVKDLLQDHGLIAGRDLRASDLLIGEDTARAQTPLAQLTAQFSNSLTEGDRRVYYFNGHCGVWSMGTHRLDPSRPVLVSIAPWGGGDWPAVQRELDVELADHYQVWHLGFSNPAATATLSAWKQDVRECLAMLKRGVRQLLPPTPQLALLAAGMPAYSVVEALSELVERSENPVAHLSLLSPEIDVLEYLDARHARDLLFTRKFFYPNTFPNCRAATIQQQLHGRLPAILETGVEFHHLLDLCMRGAHKCSRHHFLHCLNTIADHQHVKVFVGASDHGGIRRRSDLRKLANLHRRNVEVQDIPGFLEVGDRELIVNSSKEKHSALWHTFTRLKAVAPSLGSATAARTATILIPRATSNSPAAFGGHVGAMCSSLDEKRECQEFCERVERWCTRRYEEDSQHQERRARRSMLDPSQFEYFWVRDSQTRRILAAFRVGTHNRFPGFLRLPDAQRLLGDGRSLAHLAAFVDDGISDFDEIFGALVARTLLHCRQKAIHGIYIQVQGDGRERFKPFGFQEIGAPFSVIKDRPQWHAMLLKPLELRENYRNHEYRRALERAIAPHTLNVNFWQDVEEAVQRAGD